MQLIEPMDLYSPTLEIIPFSMLPLDMHVFYLFVCLCICLFDYSFISLFVYLFIRLFAYLFI